MILSAMVSKRDHGGIGRRAALKMRSPQGGEGSIPSGPIPLDWLYRFGNLCLFGLAPCPNPESGTGRASKKLLRSLTRSPR